MLRAIRVILIFLKRCQGPFVPIFIVVTNDVIAIRQVERYMDLVNAATFISASCGALGGVSGVPTVLQPAASTAVARK